MSQRWQIVDTPTEFRAEFQPDPRPARLVSVLTCVATAVCAALGLAQRSDLWWVLTILFACISAFPVALYLGLRRSFYRVSLDFVGATARVEVKKSFDPPIRFEVGLQEILLAADSTRLRIGWSEQPETSLTVETNDEAIPISVMDRTKHAVAGQI